MYGMYGKFITQAGKRAELVQILLQAAHLVGQRPDCYAYIINEDATDDVSVWVYEAWTDKTAHDASLQDEQVRALIKQAMPLMGGPPQGGELNVVGGHGLLK